jgi:phosphatidylethanolamine/phosphatidyl-N-methylethanolamine N-methyltransferase
LIVIARIRPHESKIYSRFSYLYDRIFTQFFRRRIQATISTLQIPPGAKVLEVGVGTGLSLDAYPHNIDVTGIDLSEDMLARAQRKINRHGWQHIRLRQMDALNLEFPDASFDYVMAFHVVSVVPDSDRLLREIARVCKPKGKVVIINHFRSELPWLAPMIDLLDPVTRRLGWRTTLRYSEFVAKAPLRVERRFKTSGRSLFTVMIATKPETPEPAHANGSAAPSHAYAP